MVKGWGVVLGVALLAPAAVRAGEACTQEGALVVDGLGWLAEEEARLAELEPGAFATAPSGILRRGGVTVRPLCQGAQLPWGDRYVEVEPASVSIVPPRLTAAFQASSPGGSNDGLLWQGRGFSAEASGGVRGRWGPLSAQLAPEVAWAQNAWFKLRDTGGPGRLAFSNALYGSALDLPQRFGTAPLWRAAPGQSYLQVDGFGARLGLSTENLWWGPAIRHSALLSNNAPGFPHVFLGTAEPAGIGIGTLEVEWVLGQLSRSRYTEEARHPSFSGLAVVYQPRWLPGFYLGAGRTFIETWASARSNSFASVLQSTNKPSVGDNPDDNQMFSAWFRWVMRDIELYGELAQDDFPTFNSFIRQPDRCAAWNVGFQKRAVVGDAWWRIVGEYAKTSAEMPDPWACTVYLHGRGLDYTNEGKLLGDWMGPGADSQYLAVDRFTRSGRFGAYLERVRRNQEVFFRLQAANQIPGNDVEMVGGVRQVLFTPRFDLSWDVGAGQHWQRGFARSEFVLRALVTVTPRPWAARSAALSSSTP